MAQTDKRTLQKWQDYKKNVLSDTAVDLSQSEADRRRHRDYLENHPKEWARFFFPKYATSDFAPFQIKYLNRIINNPEWYEVVSWSRELAKDTVTMFGILYLVLTGKKRFVLFVSSSGDAAEDLLMPYMINLESNQRIIAYYGEQKNFGTWETGNFKTREGASFFSLGAGQSPRGKKNEELRPDTIVLTDLDTDEDVRNPETVKKRFDWIEKALYPTRSISKPLLFLMLGNIIAKKCCVTLASEKADHHDIVNIRDKDGKSTWPAKNSEEQIDRVLSKISTKAAQSEYFNNPLSEGEIFKEMTWGKCPPLQQLRFVVAYADPSTSNKDKKKKGVSFKSVFLIGHYQGRKYIYTGFLDQVKNSDFVEWFYAIRDYVGNKTQLSSWIENNSLQDPFFEQVFKPLFRELGETRGHIAINGDSRKKPDKYERIEGNLEPLNRNGELIFNIDEKNNPHMNRLEEQFKLVTPSLDAPADGPDCVEGGVWIVNEKLKKSEGATDFQMGHRNKNNKRV